MTDTKYTLGSHLHGTRVDSFAGFTETPLPFTAVNCSADETNTKFALSSRNDMMTFDPTTTAPFSGNVQQTTVHPSVLSGNELSMFEDQNNMSEQFFAPQTIFASLSNARSQHGQVTPPDDLSPKSVPPKSELSEDGEMNKPAKFEESMEHVKTDNKRKRSNKASNSASSRKRGRKPVQTVDEEDLDPEEKAKRDQFLERNRVAAHKCRQKKKEWMTKLDEEFRNLSARNKFLQAEATMLNNTLYELKNLVFQHSDCGYSPIDEFIAVEAEKVRMRARLGSDPATSLSGPPQPHDPFSQPNLSFAGSSSRAFMGRSPTGSERVANRAGTESSDFGSLRSKSAAPDDAMAEQWTDMLQQA